MLCADRRFHVDIQLRAVERCFSDLLGIVDLQLVQNLAQSILGGCVVNGDQEGSADASGSLQALRIIVAEALGYAVSSADYAYALTMDDFLSVDAAQSEDAIFPEYKGWAWRKDAQGGSIWTPEAVPGADWAQLTGSAAAWDVLPQDDAPWQQVTKQAQPWTAAI